MISYENAAGIAVVALLLGGSLAVWGGKLLAWSERRHRDPVAVLRAGTVVSRDRRGRVQAAKAGDVNVMGVVMTDPALPIDRDHPDFYVGPDNRVWDVDDPHVEVQFTDDPAWYTADHPMVKQRMGTSGGVSFRARKVTNGVVGDPPPPGLEDRAIARLHDWGTKSPDTPPDPPRRMGDL